MRLLHTSPIQLSSFDDDASIPSYAILSHTWGDDEISFNDLLHYTESELNGSEGYHKIRSCCALAASDGHEYVWIDTCCIDKTSSAELSEAINSMYRWYQNAKVCYAYLADVRWDDPRRWNCEVEKMFMNSRWFTRGWTLQELLAPKNVVFLDRNWVVFGSNLSLINLISLVTGIDKGHINNISRASVAQKMSWACGRETRRVEDMAYSLMGLFDVNMPLLYGEGEKAFTRLQHEIVKISNDESLFAWTDGGLVESGLFAQSPKAFSGSGNIVQINGNDPDYIYRAPYAVTNRGLAIEALTSKFYQSTFILDQRFTFLPLNCRRQLQSGQVVADQLAIELERISRDDFVRFSPGQLNTPRLPNDTHSLGSSLGLVYVRTGYVPRNSHEQRLSFFIDESSLSRCGLSIFDRYDCDCEQQWDALPNETLWRVTLGSCESFATVLLQGNSCVNRHLFGIIIWGAKSTLRISLRAPSSAENFHEEIDRHKNDKTYYFPSREFAADPVSVKLQDDCWVSMALKEKRVAPDQKHYLADFAALGEDRHRPSSQDPIRIRLLEM